MKRCLLLLLACVCAHGVPLAPDMKPGSCQDASALGAAGLALSKINANRKEGFVYSLHRLSNVNQMQHGKTGMVFYLTLDVLETDCHVFSRRDSKSCAVRQITDRPVYGRCKATIYINKVHRVVRLYNYDCVVRPASATKIGRICPDCPSAMDKNHEEILKAASLSLDKFNKESGLANYFAMLNITRAAAQMGMATFYNVQYTIQETSCANSTDLTQLSKCPLMDCEFAHKGHCKGSHSFAMGNEYINVECQVFEPESAEKEKKLHLLGGETHHSHSDGHTHDHKHDHKHDAKGAHAHDHTHDHDHDHAHDHTKDHKHGPHGAAHDHHHDHDHAHNHTHDHAHNHTHDHTHLHGHEHHHHHHEHTTIQRQPVGRVTVLPALDRPMTLPSFPDQESVGPKAGVTLPVVPDTEIPGQSEPTILPFPTSISPQCPAPPKEKEGGDFMKILFAEDPLFKSA